MSLTPWKPHRLVRDLESQVDELFHELIYEPWGGTPEGNEWQPQIDIYETDDFYLIHADLPGVLPRSVEISVDNHWVTIRGIRKPLELVKAAQGVILERRQGSFSRKFFLEQAIEVERFESSYKEGIYEVRLPKKKD